MDNDSDLPWEEKDWCQMLLAMSNQSVYHSNVTSHGCGNLSHLQPPPMAIVDSATVFYTYSVPVVLAVGILGNLVSLRVFLSKSMRKLSASTYLAALSTSDILALLFYVLLEWFRLGLPHLNGGRELHWLNAPGVCQVLSYFSYVCRFLSAWFIVTFTVERYIGVCHPLRRKDICGSRSAQKVILSLTLVSLIIMLYKPILTSSKELPRINAESDVVRRCVPDLDRPLLSFVLDAIYGLMITVVPFLIISVLNALIIRKLLHRYRRYRQITIVTEESIIRMEFTIILLVVSFVFIVLNLPFCIAWGIRFLVSRQDLHDEARRAMGRDLLSEFDNLGGVLVITRVIFYMNYCVNFFLYSVTGAYFRKELEILVFYRSDYKAYLKSLRGGHGNSSPTTPQSWV